MSVSGHYLWSQEVWGPAEHSGGITGAQEDWEPPHQARPTCTHPESPLRACSHLWQRPPGPILVASPRSPIFTSMFLFKKKLPCGGERSGAVRKERGLSGSPALTLPRSPAPARTELQVPVDDAPLVQVAQAADQASKIVAHLGLRQRLPCLQHVGQRLQGPDRCRTTIEETQVSSRGPRRQRKIQPGPGGRG